MLLGCRSPSPAQSAATPVSSSPPLVVRRLDTLLARARLRYVVEVKPREVAQIPFLLPAIGRLADEPHLARFASQTGFDLRELPEAVVATYAGDGEDETLYLVRHNADQATIERRFRERLTGDVRRFVERDDVVRVSGTVGTLRAELLLIGRDVAGFQLGGRLNRGPVKIASLFAMGLLRRSPSVFSEEPLLGLSVRVWPAPFRAFALGPFALPGQTNHGILGLLARATAVAATVRPSARDALLFIVTITGDFTRMHERAATELLRAWLKLSSSSLGHLLGIDQPREGPIPTHSDEAVSMAVEVDPDRLAAGIAAATQANIGEIMR
jgi:hypothetical protein